MKRISFSKRTVVQLLLICLNVLSFAFMLSYAIIHRESNATNIFAGILLGTICLNIVYAAFTRNRWGFWLMVAHILGMTVNYLLWMPAIWSTNATSESIIGVAVLILQPLLALALLFLDLLQVKNQEPRLPRLMQMVKFIITLVLPIGMFVLALLAYDNVYNYGYSMHEYTTSRAEFLFAFLLFGLFFAMVRLTIAEQRGPFWKKIQRTAALLTICLGLAGFGLAQYWKGFASIPQDVAAADVGYQAMFGRAAAQCTKDNFRQVPFSLADIYFGIPTKGYGMDRNIPYRTIEDGVFSGVQLSYDMYYPEDADAHKSVILYLHGSGNDKDDGNHPQHNKYFAAQGYVVYDIQLCDYNEKGTNYPKGVAPDYDLMLENIDHFFQYAVEHNMKGANFNSVFVIGASMGGFLACDYLYNQPNMLQKLGVHVRGAIPCYGGDVEKVQKDSIPMLYYFGSHDGVVSVELLYKTQQQYQAAKNQNFMPVLIQYAAHGCDGHFVVRANQIFLYYLERFMDELR